MTFGFIESAFQNVGRVLEIAPNKLIKRMYDPRGCIAQSLARRVISDLGEQGPDGPHCRSASRTHADADGRVFPQVTVGNGNRVFHWGPSWNCCSFITV